MIDTHLACLIKGVIDSVTLLVTNKCSLTIQRNHLYESNMVKVI